MKLPKINFKFTKHDWILIPFIGLMGFCFWLFWNRFSVFAFLNPFFFLSEGFMAFLLLVFGGLFIRSFVKRSVPAIAQKIAYIFSIIFLITALAILAGKGQSCTGFFGVSTECSETRTITAYFFLLNPYSIILWNILAFIGIASLWPRRKKKK